MLSYFQLLTRIKVRLFNSEIWRILLWKFLVFPLHNISWWRCFCVSGRGVSADWLFVWLCRGRGGRRRAFPPCASCSASWTCTCPGTPAGTPGTGSACWAGRRQPRPACRRAAPTGEGTRSPVSRWSVPWASDSGASQSFGEEMGPPGVPSHWAGSYSWGRKAGGAHMVWQSVLQPMCRNEVH